MTLSLGNITFDCTDPRRVAGFWAQALDRPVDDGANEFFASLRTRPDEPTWLFIKVPEGKSAKNRLHVDLRADDRETEVARLVGLGATRHDDHDQYGVAWTVLTDVEGNEFCVGQPSI